LPEGVEFQVSIVAGLPNASRGQIGECSQKHCLVQLFPEWLKFDSSLDRNAFCNPETPESDIFAFGIPFDIARRCPDPNSACHNLMQLFNAILRNGVDL
jgi:hypothetical protein